MTRLREYTLELLRPSARLTLRLRLASVVLLVGSFPAQAQVFQVSGGSSSLYRAHGAAVEIRARNYEGWVGVGGSLGKPRFGAFLRTQIRGYKFSFGDDALPFRLPTDLFNTGHYFLGRGVGVAGGNERLSFYGFAGATAKGLSTPFFGAATFDKTVGAFFLDAQLTPTVRFHSRNVFSAAQTSIHSVEWHPRADLQAALAAGLGSNQGYFAASLNADRTWLSLMASYVRAGDRFRRIVVQTPLSAETDRENIQIVLKPKPYLTLLAGRQNFLQPFDTNRQPLRGALNNYGATATLAGFSFGVRLFDSRVLGARTLGTSYTVARNFAERLQANVNLLQSRPPQGPRLNTLVTTLREILSPRLSLLQLITHSDGHTSMAFGGNFLSNWVTVGVEYQTIFLPFETRSQFKQALVLNLRLQPFGNYQFNAGTYIAPDGKVKYTVYASTFLYGAALGVGAPAADIILPKYVILGRVTDEEGRPLRGVALRIDGEVAYTDSQGQFFVRKRKARSYTVAVLLDEFLVPGRFEVVSAPATAAAAPEDKASRVSITLRRAPRPSPEPPSPENVLAWVKLRQGTEQWLEGALP